MIYASETLAIAIDKPFKPAYDYISDPANFPKWAASFCQAIALVDGKWVAETPIGKLAIRFVERNDYGVLDHYVAIPAGPELLNPMRLVPNRSGCVLTFTLFQPGHMSDAEFREDKGMVLKDLETLKAVLEKSA
jgi:hypothetical protein